MVAYSFINYMSLQQYIMIIISPFQDHLAILHSKIPAIRGVGIWKSKNIKPYRTSNKSEDSVGQT